MTDTPRPGDFYRHYKGGVYVFQNVATHSETGERMAIYFPIEDRRHLWVRPLAMFCETLPDGRKRFEHIDTSGFTLLPGG